MVYDFESSINESLVESRYVNQELGLAKYNSEHSFEFLCWAY